MSHAFSFTDPVDDTLSRELVLHLCKIIEVPFIVMEGALEAELGKSRDQWSLVDLGILAKWVLPKEKPLVLHVLPGGKPCVR